MGECHLRNFHPNMRATKRTCVSLVWLYSLLPPRTSQTNVRVLIHKSFHFNLWKISMRGSLGQLNLWMKNKFDKAISRDFLSNLELRDVQKPTGTMRSKRRRNQKQRSWKSTPSLTPPQRLTNRTRTPVWVLIHESFHFNPWKISARSALRCFATHTSR